MNKKLNNRSSYTIKKYAINILKKIGKIMLYIVGIIIILVIAIILFLKFAAVFGGTVEGERLERMQKLDYFVNGSFQNLAPKKEISPEEKEDFSFIAGIKLLLSPDPSKNPTKPLPSEKFDKTTLKNGDMVWFGHSTILLRTEDTNILIDPVFHRASPIAIFGKSFEIEHKAEISDLPDIDAIVISHDHYDHLDYKAIVELSQKTDRFFVPIGLGAHLESWGVAKEKIIESAWYESSRYKNIDFTLTPMQHFSGRGVTDRNKTLWGSWVIKSKSLALYFSGDGGYSEEFKTIGERYGPFDIAFIENGAYSKNWVDIHMLPEESVQAGIDVGAKVLFPIHWSKFDLSFHKWDEPINRFTTEATGKGKKVATPMIGEVFTLTNIPTKKWWNDLIQK